ncbi:amidoligase family protein [Vagococcus elongatus]|uniref:Uncharacterized protein n=1 Tax=Vagococcus elongatus TaxID=180344 RepID=A0A430AYB1_9ENTE|nr:amidoligase family protein [Vagococcus elongatus]RSU13028.1 hypothetical protein CBF29_04995 [Vagococcus elongatus]
MLNSIIFHPISRKEIALKEISDHDVLIKDHIFRPKTWERLSLPNETKEDIRFFGLEFEFNIISTKKNKHLDNTAICRNILSLLNASGPHFHIMVDNSVRNGIEIVSNPMSIAYIRKMFNFPAITKELENLGLVASNDTGFHIHAGFNHTLRERNLILKLFSISYPLWLELSRRKIVRLQNRYVSTEFFMMNEKTQRRHEHNILSLMKTGNSFVDFNDLFFDNYEVKNRYNAINFLNPDTVEFRLLNGTVNPEIITESIDFITDFIALVDEISVTREDDIFHLHHFVERTNSSPLLNKTVKQIKKTYSLLEKNRLYYNYFYLLDCYWYESSLTFAEEGDYVITIKDYQHYLTLLKKITALLQRGMVLEANPIKEQVNDFLLASITEVVLVEDFVLGVIPVIHNVSYTELSKEHFHKKYVLLKGVNKDLVTPLLKYIHRKS